MECLICNKPLDGEVSKITEVGLAASKIRNDGKFELFQRRLEEGNLKLHVSCRKDYTRKTSLQKALKETHQKDGKFLIRQCIERITLIVEGIK